MEAIINQITDHLEAAIPQLKYVDEDWGQLDYYSPNFPVKWPCALVDIQSATWDNLLKKVQHGLVQVSVKIADIKISNSSTKAPAGQRTKANSFFTLTQTVFKALHTWSGSDDYSGLIRTAERRIKRDDGVKVYELIFTTQFKDTSAMPVMQTAQKPTVRFEVSLIK
jgi:hypothetical protein